MKTNFYTGRGDGGKSLHGNKRLSKGDLLFEVLGNLDEFNSWLGVCRASLEKKDNFRLGRFSLDEILKSVERDIFIIQAEVAAAGFEYSIKKFKKITAEKTAGLERIIEWADAKLPPLRNFIMPGGSEVGARLDYGRSLVRRVERSIVKFSEKRPLSPETLQYLNRLSSLLFALARYANFAAGAKEENPDYH